MLKCFEIFLPLVRGNLELLQELALDFVKRQAQQHVVYTEMRYSPHLLAKGASLSYNPNDNNDDNNIVNADPIVDAITKGLRRGEEEYGVKVSTYTLYTLYDCVTTQLCSYTALSICIHVLYC
jgi:adenosine deaminase